MLCQKNASKSRKKLHLPGLLVLFSMLSVFVCPGMGADKRLLILPLAFYIDESKGYLRQGINNMLVSRLSGEGLDVISDDVFSSLLTEKDKQGITSEKRAEELARQLKAEYALFGSVTSAGAGYSLDLSVLDLSKQQVSVKTISEAVTEDQLIPKLSDVVYDVRAIIAGVDIRRAAAPKEEEKGKGLFFKPSGESMGFKPSGRFSIKTGIMSIGTGDLDGDGQSELVVLTRESLMVYKRKQQSFELMETLRKKTGEDFLKVSVGDMDGNGRAEIYLASFYSGRAQTSVYEWPGRFRMLVDHQTGHYRVAEAYGSGRDRLLFQDSSVEDFFKGSIFFAGFENGKLVRKDPLPNLKGAQFYTLILYDVDRTGTLEFIGLGAQEPHENSNIVVWDQSGGVFWQSPEKVGGTNNAIRFGKANPDDQRPRVLFNSRLVITDTDNDGKKELLAVTNIAMTKYMDFWYYEKGNVTAYRIQDKTLAEMYKTTNLTFPITDMEVEGQTLYISCAKEQILEFGEGAGRIMWFE